MGVFESLRLDGKVGMVTGGARNLGYDMAEALAEAGCDLAITSRSLENANRSALTLRESYDVDVLPLALDVTDYSQITAAASRITDWKGRLDVLINNAGGGGGGAGVPTDLFERSVDVIRQLLDTNLLGTILCCKAVGMIMAGQRSGKIINIASIAGVVGRDRSMYEGSGLSPQPVDYAAAKAGVIGLTRDLAAYLAPKGVYVNAISPGGFQRGQPEEFVRAYSARTALGRMGRDGVDLKAAALFLASSASDYVTGENLVVDGGFSVWH
jgi:NAD(P)-dependent dehydrogenase (short-subunit alcohol dehydrogenase family)